MTLSKLKTREQVLIAIVMIVLLLGSYTLFRFVPENKRIVSLQKQAAKTERKLLKARIPDEPEQGVDELLQKLDDQEKSLQLVNEITESIEQKLAPFNSQQLIIMISQLARQSGVVIKTSEALKAASLNKTLKKKKKKKRKKAAATKNVTDAILPASRRWIDRMSATTMFHRPMHRVIIEGDYESLRTFIHGLDDLQWQVTVVQLHIQKMPTAPMNGYAQRLKSELVLAL